MPLCFMTFVSAFLFFLKSFFLIINYLRKVFEKGKKKVDEASLFMRMTMMVVMKKTMWELGLGLLYIYNIWLIY